PPGGPPPPKPHPRAATRLAYCLRGSRVVFVALDVSFHILRRHQPNLVAELRQITCPVVRGGTSLHANEARRQRREKGNHLTAAKLLPDDDLLSRIDAVDLKHVLGDIQTDCGNLHVDGSLMWFVATITLRRFVAGSGRRPPHQERTHALQKTAPYSITSSAMASSPGGKLRPNALAVLRLITNSNLIDWMTGRSAGFSPLRIRPVYTPAWRYASVRLVP